MSEIDHEYTKTIVCPWCGVDFYDDDWCYSDEDEHEVECDTCEKPFTVTATISVTYSTKRQPCSGGHEFEYQRHFAKHKTWERGGWVELPASEHRDTHIFQCRLCHAKEYVDTEVGGGRPEFPAAPASL